MVTKLKKMETKLKKMETKIFISMTKDELETLIINCVNACLRNDKTKKSRSHRRCFNDYSGSSRVFTFISSDTLFEML